MLALLVLAVPSLYLLYVWPWLPAQVPTHFGLDGHADGYSSRSALWLLALALPLGIGLLLTALPWLDPKRRLDAANVNFQKLRLALVALPGSPAIYCVYLARHPDTPPSRSLLVLIGFFFALLGNYLTTVQPNYFVGIRTPWTLKSTAVWARTHWMGGMVFCGIGLLMAGLGLVLPPAWIQPLLLTGTLGTALFCYAYSYFIFRQEAQRRQTAWALEN